MQPQQRHYEAGVVVRRQRQFIASVDGDLVGQLQILGIECLGVGRQAAAFRLVEQLDLLDRGGLIRVGLAPYNTMAELERLVSAVTDLSRSVR